jgi:hypothetical protein
VYRQLIDWLIRAPNTPPELRGASRVPDPKVAVHYWDGSAPAAHQLRDVSATGAYLYTAERWYPGTIIRLLLQEHAPGTDEPASVSLAARVVRHGSDGIALEFLFRGPEDRQLLVQLVSDTRGRDSIGPAIGTALAGLGQPAD